MFKRKLNQEIIEIAHILMDTMQKQAKMEDTNQVLSSFEQGNGVISPLKSEYRQQNDYRVEKQAKTKDTQQVLSSLEHENSVTSPLKSEYHRQDDCRVEKQTKTKDTQQMLSSFERENSVISPLKSEYHQQDDCRVGEQAKSKDTKQLLPLFEQENGVVSPRKSEDHQQSDCKVEKQNETQTLDTHQREEEVDEQDEKVDETNSETLDDEPMSMNNEENDDGLVIGPRERLKRHRNEVAGQVWIPDLWGQEDLLKDWIDCSAFDKCLMNHTLMSARASLVEEGRRANSTTLSVENSC